MNGVMKNLSRLEIFGITCFIVTSIAFVSCTGYRMYQDSMERNIRLKESAERAMPGTILIHIDGAIENPGVYEITEGARISNVIDAAGGFIDDANQALLNLAEVLQDGQKIYVPSLGETITSPLVTQSDAIMKMSDARNQGFPINLNTATKEQLMTLPSIGETKADDIINYRKARGGFKKTSDLLNVKGIGEKTYEKLKDLIYI